MGGSGGGFRRYRPEAIRRWLEPSIDQTAVQTHNANVAATLNDLLAQYNDRDVDLITDRLEEIREHLQEEVESSLDLRFGGSIQKHTYVDGLSDIDALMFLRDPSLTEQRPEDVLDLFKSILENELRGRAEIQAGEMAVTLTYPDGMEIQILPAVKSGSGVKISAEHGQEWSRIVRPETFARKLTECNQANGGKVVPTIKLAKVVISNLPEKFNLSGYHIESLAIEAFKNYIGPQNTKEMLHHFFLEANDLVRSPIRDRTGQSLNLDEYLGEAGSSERMAIGDALGRISRRMTIADKTASTTDWLRAIGE